MNMDSELSSVAEILIAMKSYRMPNCLICSPL
jgi:hypothetical protein